MSLYRCVLFAVALVAAAPSAHSLDMAKVTFRSFAASGHDNMAAVIMWLRGYHAGRTGIVATTAGRMPSTLKELTRRDRCAFVRSITKEIQTQKQIHLGCERDGARLRKDDPSLDSVGLVEQTLPLCIILGLAGAIGGATKLDPLA
jgi:hypothetical protein